MAEDQYGQQNMFQRFFNSQASGAIVLVVCALGALIWANSPWGEVYERISHAKIGVSWGDATFKMGLSHWIKDGLMAFFFFVVGLEIKREIVVGQLSTLRRAALPVGAAVGGMLVPALIYFAFNAGGAGSRGWGVPMATDIAFALGILALFGSRVPVGLKVFLTALAIADDMGAVLVIAIFYTSSIKVSALLVAAGFLVAIVLFHRLRWRHTWFYMILATGAWASVDVRSLDNVGQKAQESSALDSAGQFPLLLGRDGGNAAWNDLTAFGDVTAQQAHVLVVDLWGIVAGERACLATTVKGSACATCRSSHG